jgi:hypothetical protein|tara:strand:+ start:1274 stop:1570 length:297 start_codon:yes stop_codon:yes gene_type:complete
LLHGFTVFTLHALAISSFDSLRNGWSIDISVARASVFIAQMSFFRAAAVPWLLTGGGSASLAAAEQIDFGTGVLGRVVNILNRLVVGASAWLNTILSL